MQEESLLHLEQAGDAFITSERRSTRRFEKTILAISMATPLVRLDDDPEGKFKEVANIDALIRFKSVLTNLHHRIAKGEEVPDRRLCEIVMAMGYDHLANFFLGYYKKELSKELPEITENIFASIRRKVGVYVREVRTKLQERLASGAHQIIHCHNCSSQAFIFPKVIRRDGISQPDTPGECYLCNSKGRVRICTACEEAFFPSDVNGKKLTVCGWCKGSKEQTGKTGGS
jgi:hypothetical protein